MFDSRDDGRLGDTVRYQLKENSPRSYCTQLHD